MVTIKLTNKAVHTKHISLGGGSEQIRLPVTEHDVAVSVSVDPTATPEEAARLHRALKSPPVQAWVEAGELKIEGDLDALLGKSAPVAPTKAKS